MLFRTTNHFSKNLSVSHFFFQLLALGLPFGRVKNVLLLKAKKPHEPTQVGTLQLGCSLNDQNDAHYLQRG